MSGVIPIVTYLQLSYLLTQLIYSRAKSPPKGLFLFHKVWNMPVLFSICFYQIQICITNDCAKTLMMGVKLMRERFIKILTQKVKVSAKKSKCHKNNSYIFLHYSDGKTLYIDIYFELLSINVNFLSVLQHMLTIRSVNLKSILHQQQHYSQIRCSS